MNRTAPSQREKRRPHGLRYRISPASTRAQALRLLTTFLLTPQQLAFALNISSSHAYVLLRRLWRDGTCSRSCDRLGMRYRLRERV